ncbi:hypothetical protein NE237_028976 [Protea cynaroides]|uniref:Protein kish n=1 Tax=Protea cynaroides TaxID=273540 RepID=A0A9Q0JTE0_9MAGN|nr:hypothetical protein NE237_028976 [Protea cynaroides]
MKGFGSGTGSGSGTSFLHSSTSVELPLKIQRVASKANQLLKENPTMSALFNFRSFLTVVLLVICSCTYVKMHFPTLLQHKTGFRGFFWKAARIGERLSPWVAVGCFTMGVSIIIS